MVSRKARLERLAEQYELDIRIFKDLLTSIYKEIERESLHTHTKRKGNKNEKNHDV